ncbi:unnamed protein product [Cuscuta epithymum]|uniref:Glutathione S-transferase n=1 Tax=Cuscuta epithymum TaxID=186058 RepID=A0AAV0GGL8_9ASTE|nr:unnamed protein product [Cuscuta epithymum]
MASDDFKLLGTKWSPYVLRVQVALNLKSLNYEFIEEKLYPKSELLLKLNPIYKKVPVLIHNDNPISESPIIVQYIDDVWVTSGPSIFPCDPYDRAVTKFWSFYIDDKVLPVLLEVSSVGDKAVKKEVIDDLVELLAPLEDVFKSCSKGGKFFGGDRIGYLDIALGSFVGWFKVIETFNDIKLFDDTRFSRLSKWIEDFAIDDAVINVMPSTEKLVELIKGSNKRSQPN